MLLVKQMVHKNYIMLAKLSIDQVLKKAKLHAKKREFLEAQRPYQLALHVISKNVRPKQDLQQ